MRNKKKSLCYFFRVFSKGFVSFVLTSLIIVGQIITPQVASAATYDFVQSSWVGGQTSNVSNSRTGWNQYSSKTNTEATSSVSLSTNSFSSVQTSASQFSSGSESQTDVFGNGDAGYVGLATSTFTSPKMYTGFNSSYSVKSDGSIWSWGDNTYGQLGVNSTTQKNSPTQVYSSDGMGYLKNITEVTATDFSAYALKSDGTVWSWGDNTYGQLGDDSTTQRNLPVQVKGLNGSGFLTNVVAIASGKSSAYALKSDGTVWAWGDNTYGQLGDSSTSQRNTPVQVKGVGGSGNLTGVSSITATFYAGYALKTDGTVWSWGDNEYGQLGDDSTTDRSTPVQVKGLNGSGFLTEVASLSAGEDSVYALKSDGTVWAWGSNDNGRLGDNTTTYRDTPVQVLGLGASGFLTDIIAVSSAKTSAHALKSDGTVWSWGDNTTGQLGDNSTTERNTPVQVLGSGGSGYLTSIIYISSSSAIKSDGTIWTWGTNATGQLGDNSITQRNAPVQVVLAGLMDLTYGEGSVTPQIEGGSANGYLLKKDGTVWAWGYGGQGRNGNASTSSKSSAVQVLGNGGVGVLENIIQIAGGESSAYALSSNGEVWAWGDNANGKLGDNTILQKTTPVKVLNEDGSGNLTGIDYISGGSQSAYAVKSGDGSVWAWGLNSEGQLGDNSQTTSYLPVRSGSLIGIEKVHSGYYSAYAVNSSGAVWSWGYNSGAGILGNNSTTRSTVPVEVLDSSGAGQLQGVADAIGSYKSSGTSSSFAVKSGDGSIWAWGANGYNQLGDNSTTDRKIPVATKGYNNEGTLVGMTKVSASSAVGRALKSDGTVWSWGRNSAGEIGDGSKTQRATPVQVSNLSNIIDIGSGDSSGYALHTDGVVYSWGSNSDGRLGDGTTTERLTPVRVQYIVPDSTFINLGTANYYSSGTYTSPVVDLEGQASLGTISYDTTLNSQTITIDVRAGNTATPDGTWTSWLSNVSNNGNISSLGSKRYVQYRANMSTSNTAISPRLNAITINYNQYYLTGDITSSVYDTSDSTNLFGSIAWTSANTSASNTIKFQVRSSADNNTWSEWCGYADCSGNTYFETANSGVSVSAEHPLRSGVNDRYLQYKAIFASDGVSSATLNSVTVLYVVNATPVFNQDYPEVSGGGASALQDTDVESSSFGKVKIYYSAKDIDSTSGSYTPNKILPSFEYSIDGGSTWDSIPSEDLEEGDVTLKNILESTYTEYTATWSAKDTEAGVDVSNAKIRVSINDGEVANSTATATSANFVLDTKAPVVSTPITFDAGVAGISDSASITIPLPTDTKAVQYRIKDNEQTESNPEDTGWVSLTEETVIPWVFDTDIESKHLIYQFRDSLGNETVETTASTHTPVPTSSFMVQDTSNVSVNPAYYDLYIGWQAITGEGFATYKLEQSTSSDNSNYSSYSDIESESLSDISTNYFVYRNLDPDLYYKFRLGILNTEGNISVRSNSSITTKPDGVQNFGEGGGGSVLTAPKVENIIVSQGEDKNIDISYRLTDSSLAKKLNPSYEAYVFYNIGIILPEGSLSGSTLTISDASKLKSSGYVQVNNEVIRYTGKNGNTLTGITRGTWPTGASQGRASRTNSTLFAGTPVWIMANNTPPVTITNDSIVTGQNGIIEWNTYGETGLAGSSYPNVGIRVLVHDNQDVLSGPLSSQNDYSEIGTLNTLDLTAPSLSFDSTSSFGEEDTTPVIIPFSISRAYPFNSSANFVVTGTATNNSDYVLANGTVEVQAGSTTGSISLVVVDDTIKDGNETVIITLSSPTNASLGSNTVFTYTIIDNEGESNVGFREASSSGLESVTSVNIPVDLSLVSGSNVSFDYTVTGTATSGEDFVLTNGTKTIISGETSTTIDLSVVDDGNYEESETVIITLSNISGSTLNENISHTYTILDNDSTPEIQFTSSSSSALEDADSVSLPVSLSAVSHEDITVDYQVTGGTATQGEDYTLSSGTVTIAQGQTTGGIDLSIINDSIKESTETVIVTLSNPINSVLGTNSVFTFSIEDDEITYEITSSSGDNGTISPLGVTTVLRNSSQEYTITPNEGYVISNITVNGVSLNPSSVIDDNVYTFSNVTSNQTIYVGFTYEDTVPPVITLNGDNPMSVVIGDTYNEPGATATDAIDGTRSVNISGTVNTNATGAYSVTYTAIDTSGNIATETRVVNVVYADSYNITSTTGDNGTITPLGVTAVASSSSQSYAITPNEGYGIDSLVVDGVRLSPSSTYTFENVLANHSISVTFSLEADTVPPVITLNGDNPMEVIIGDTYNEPGATAEDDRDGEVLVSITGVVNPNAIGEYRITYRAVDTAKNASEETRVVSVVYADTYSITATTNEGGSISPSGVTEVASNSDITYTITPDQGNPEDPDSLNYQIATIKIDGVLVPNSSTYTFTNVIKDRTIEVTFSLISNNPPIITIIGDNPMDIIVGYPFVDPGATAVDGLTGAPLSVTATGVVNASLSGSYTITYIASDSSGAMSTAERTVNVIDMSPPVISDISTPVRSSNSAVIVWKTNEPATTEVDWGLESGNLNRRTIFDETLTTYHVVSLGPSALDADGEPSTLSQTTKYYFVVRSMDSTENMSESVENEFTTTNDGRTIILNASSQYSSNYVPDGVAPTISDILVENITGFGADVTFKTDKLTVSNVNYGKDQNYSSDAGGGDWKDWKTEHSVKLRGLTIGTEYHFRIMVVDKFGNTSVSEDQKFTTKFLSEALAEIQKIENIEQFQKEIEATIESIFPSLVPPFIEKPEVSEITENSAKITFRTNVKAYPVVSYTNEDNFNQNKANPYDGEVSDISTKNINHTIQLLGLKPNTKYHFVAKAFSLPQVVGKSNDTVFTTSAPKIKGSIVDIKKDSFSVVWNTEEPASSIVEYKNLTTGRINRIVDDGKTTSHSMKIENLSPGTAYEVTVSGLNEKGNLVEGGSVLSTRTSTDNTPPVITNLKVDSALVTGRTDRVQTIISWQTDEPSTSVVYYQDGSGSLKDELANRQENSELTTNHVVILTVLKPGTIYRFTVSSTDDAGNTVKPPIRTIITPKKTESIVDVIFKNFDETFNFINNVR